MSVHFEISSDPLDGVSLSSRLADSAAGAVVTFDGRVRDHNAGRRVLRLEYQVYPALAEKTGRRILEEAVEEFGLTGAVGAHRSGSLEIGGCAVWLGVAAAHRGAAFDAARTIMERFKYELPVWKREHYPDGASAWLGPDNTSPETGLPSGGESPEWDAELLEIWISRGHDFRGHHGGPRGNHGIESLAEVECVAGMGLRGDRYFGYKDDFKGQVTFFDEAVIRSLCGHFQLAEISGRLFRRNLIVRGVDLNAWVGRRFRFQGIEFEGSEECRPCYWMDQAVGPGAEELLKGRGGLRARILGSGVLRVGR